MIVTTKLFRLFLIGLFFSVYCKGESEGAKYVAGWSINGDHSIDLISCREVQIFSLFHDSAIGTKYSYYLSHLSANTSGGEI